VHNRVKSMNESIYYNVDALHTAISEDRMVAFRYFDIGVDKKRIYRSEGEVYEVSPVSLVWDNDNYYLVALSDKGAVRHYRVDKMDKIRVLEQPRSPESAAMSGDMEAYKRRTFSMFGGEEEVITVEFERELAGAMMDRFGTDIIISPAGGSRYSFAAAVVVSPQLYAWISAFGGRAAITAPDWVVQDMKEHLAKVLAGLPG